VAREGFLKDKCGPGAKKFEHHWCTVYTHVLRRFTIKTRSKTFYE